MKYSVRTILSITVAICSIILPCIAAELELKQESKGPTYEETVEFISTYPGYRFVKGYSTSNLMVENCVLRFDWQGDDIEEGRIFKTRKKGESGTAVLNLRDTVAILNNIDTDKNTCWLYDNENRNTINSYCEYFYFKHKNGQTGWKIYGGDMINGKSFQLFRYKAAFDHLRKLCGAKDSPF